MAFEDAYLEHRVMTATPWELHGMTLEGAIRHATVAREAMLVGEFDRSHAALNSSRALVGELLSGLRGEAAPGLAPELLANLRGLFAFVYRRLMQADAERKPEYIGDALRVLALHQETWNELGEKLRAEGYFTTPRGEPVQSNFQALV